MLVLAAMTSTMTSTGDVIQTADGQQADDERQHAPSPAAGGHCRCTRRYHSTNSTVSDRVIALFRTQPTYANERTRYARQPRVPAVHGRRRAVGSPRRRIPILATQHAVRFGGRNTANDGKPK